MDTLSRTRKLTTVAMLCAMAFASVLIFRIPVVLFLKYEPKDVIIAIGGFIFGPLTALGISFVVSFVEMLTISDTGLFGFFMNVVASASFACTASWIYGRKRTFRGALLGMLCATLLTTAVMLGWNYLIVPLYTGYPREAVLKLLLPAFLPFNLLKCGLNTTFILLLYKPLVTILRNAGLVADSGHTLDRRGYAMPAFVGTLILSVCILIFMAMQKTI